MDRNKDLIAPCGIYCGICACYLALKFDVKSQGVKIPYCSGCRIRNKQCAYFKKSCKLLKEGKIKFCYECPDFPCHNLKTIDKRYRVRYHMSMIENQNYMKEHGIEKFMDIEAEKWKCPECGDTICCHNGICFNCGLETLKTRKKVYRWGDDQK